MTVSKTAITVSSVALALMFGGGAYLLTHMNQFAKEKLIRVASQTLGVPVTVGDLAIDVGEKKVNLTQVNIANPDGYDGAYVLQAPRIEIAFDRDPEDVLVLKQVTVTAPAVKLEEKSGVTNMAAIGNHIESVPPVQNQTETRIIVDSLGMVDVRLEIAGSGDVEALIVPDILMTSIGNEEEGLTASEAIRRVWHGLTEQIQEAAQILNTKTSTVPAPGSEEGQSDVQRGNSPPQPSGSRSPDLGSVGKDLKRLVD